MKPALADNECGPGYFVSDCPGRGKGVYTIRQYLTGAYVMAFAGTTVQYHAISDFTHYIQIGPQEFLSPSGEADDFVNHSCDPNCALYLESGAMIMRTIRTIEKGDELTLDYGTILFSEPTSFTCECGSHNCRGQVGSYFLLPQHIRDYYRSRNMVPLLSLYSVNELQTATFEKVISLAGHDSQ